MCLSPCHSRKHTHPIGMVHCWESECRGGTQGLLPACAPLHSGVLSPASHLCTLVPPLSGGKQKLIWRGNCSA